ncbi:MAG: hypothetical protein ACE5HZ_06965 [Fidelibacterota bacterium]
MIRLTCQLFALAYFFIAVSCNSDTDESLEPIPIIVDDSLYLAAIDKPQAEFSIEKAEIEGDILNLTVSFLGGCKEHEFALIAGTGYEKSNPPRAHVILTHDAREDTCTDKVSESLLFDLSPLKDFDPSGMGKFGVILIPLEGLAEPLRYEFSP